jgi:uncharacterized protein YjbI with pentapeptide repeats
MTDCQIHCNGGPLNADQLRGDLLKACEQGTVSVAQCSIDPNALAPLLTQAHPDMRLLFSAVRGAIDLQGTQLRELVIVGSNLDRVDLHDATLDRVRIAPSLDPMPDAYAEAAVAPVRIAISTVDARGCHARTFALLASDVGDVNLKHARIDDTLDLTWTKAGTLSMRFGDVLRVEGARLTTQRELDMFGARTSQASLAWADLGTLNAETASVDRVLSLSHTTIHGRLDGFWLSAGALIFDQTHLDSVDLGYAHLGLLDISSVTIGAGPVAVAGLHVDAIGGDVQPLTTKMAGNPDAAGAFHSIEAALRNGGKYEEANTVAYQGSRFSAGVAGKLPTQGATLVIVALAVFVGVAMFCCRPWSKDVAAWLRTFLCALDIVLPSFVDIGALSAWTNYGDASKPKGAVELEGWHRTMAFVMRILGTIAFTYLLLYVTNIRG